MRRSLLRRFWRNSRKISGFSLVEVLVTTVLTTLLVSSLLTIMVELTSANQTEHASSTTNEEMKQALDHIAAELREAIYVYTGEELERPLAQGGRRQGTRNINPLETYLPNFGANARPILAFWKVEPVPYDGIGSLPSDCSSFTTLQNECEVLLTERRTYTLVVYVQSTDNPNNEWKGDSRIWRYQLRKYSNLSTVTQTIGYRDPTLDSTFQHWPYPSNGIIPTSYVSPQLISGSYVPLVDFVASPTTLVGSINCPVTRNPPVTGNLEYKTSPLGTEPIDDSTFYQANDAKSFYACVRDASSDTATAFNQDVMIYLRGNSKGKPGVERDDMIEILQNQSISRGVVRKTVGD